MSARHLLLISLGPVQDFIAQARRTRDLWFGSHLLSELSRAAARSLARDGAALIFPSLQADDPELLPCDEPVRSIGHPNAGHPPISVANKILAEAPSDREPSELLTSARKAAMCRWLKIARQVREKRGRTLIADSIDDVWAEQIDDVLEFYGVWVPFGGDYDDARLAAERALAGRKNLRDFRSWHHDRVGAPKSSLDGARVSVLKRDRSHEDFRRFRIGETEQLDAVGVIKRTGFEPEQFVPLVNVAAGEWIWRAARAAPAELEKLAAACAGRSVPKIHRAVQVVAPFPFDATVLYPERWAPLFKAQFSVTDTKIARSWGEAHVRPLLRAMRSEPPSYIACLVADGDRMGAAISALPGPDANRKFSELLAQFPTGARQIVENEHLGSLVYAGGDDVLAFVPTVLALSCARALAEKFRKLLEGAVPAEVVPTLSVGLGIGHVMEPMSGLLALGRDAERAAKAGGRNALAILVDKRSGGRRQTVLSWHDDPLARLKQDRGLLDGRLSTGKVYELEMLLKRMPDPDGAADIPANAAAALFAYANGTLIHSSEGSDGVQLDELGVHPDANYAHLRADMLRAIDRLLIARFVGAP